MNWMIDGAHGDLYRRAMGHPELKSATDEWEAERRLGTAPRPRTAHTLSRLFARLKASLTLDTAVTTSPKEGFLS